MEWMAIDQYSHLTAALDTEVFCLGIHRIDLPNPPKSGVKETPKKGIEGNQVGFKPLPNVDKPFPGDGIHSLKPVE